MYGGHRILQRSRDEVDAVAVDVVDAVGVVVAPKVGPEFEAVVVVVEPMEERE